MAALPVISGPEAVRVFKRLGWGVARQRGSHVILVKEGHNVTLSVPDHKKLARGTIRALMRRSGLTIDEFLRARR